MSTSTRVERIPINTDDDGTEATTYYTNDPDLFSSSKRARSSEAAT